MSKKESICNSCKNKLRVEFTITETHGESYSNIGYEEAQEECIVKDFYRGIGKNQDSHCYILKQIVTKCSHFNNIVDMVDLHTRKANFGNSQVGIKNIPNDSSIRKSTKSTNTRLITNHMKGGRHESRNILKP